MSLGVQLRRPQRNPLVLCFAGQVVLGQVRTIHGRIVIGADDRHRVLVALTSQHVGRGQTGGATSDDHNR